MKFGDFIELVLWYKRISKVDLAKLLNTSTTSVDRIIHDSISNLTELKDKYGEGYGNVTYFDMEKCVEDFRKAMKGGK